MTWTAPMTAVAGSIFTAAQFNTYVRDNLLECPAAKSTTAGSIFATDNSGLIVERIPVTARVDAAESTTSASPADLATVGPSVTCTTGSHALIIWSAEMGNTTVSAPGIAGVLISGATSESPTVNNELRQESSGASEFQRASTVRLKTDLTPGVNTFKMQYWTTTGTLTLNYRELTVIPL